MSDPFERKLAAEFVIGKLKKEYHNNQVVAACLNMAKMGDVSLSYAMIECIKALVEQNDRFMKQLVIKARIEL